MKLITLRNTNKGKKRTEIKKGKNFSNRITLYFYLYMYRIIKGYIYATREENKEREKIKKDNEYI